MSTRMGGYNTYKIVTTLSPSAERTRLQTISICYFRSVTNSSISCHAIAQSCPPPHLGLSSRCCDFSASGLHSAHFFLSVSMFPINVPMNRLNASLFIHTGNLSINIKVIIYGIKRNPHSILYLPSL